MKKALVLTLIFSVILSCPCYASEETHRLAREAGIEYDTPLEEVLRRQEARNQSKANNSTLNTENTSETNARPLKSNNDELRIYGTGQDTVKVTDTDGLHIYSNDYENPSGYSKYSNDEFKIAGKETPANDGYSKENFDELHIDPVYQKKLWKPGNEVIRLSIDEIRLPNDPY